MCYFIICGGYRRYKLEKNPPEPLKSAINKQNVFYCRNCACFRSGQARRYNTWFHLFFIPIFRCKKGEVFLACSQCRFPMDVNSSGMRCRNCAALVTFETRFCPSCGTASPLVVDVG